LEIIIIIIITIFSLTCIQKQTVSILLVCLSNANPKVNQTALLPENYQITSEELVQKFKAVRFEILLGKGISFPSSHWYFCSTFSCIDVTGLTDKSVCKIFDKEQQPAQPGYQLPEDLG
jgi:hypothetical protein